MGRKKILFGNWKMNNTLAQSADFCAQAGELSELALKKGVTIGVAPSYLSLSYVIAHKAGLEVFAQEVHYKDHGAFTGNVSVPMIQEIGCQGSLVGHSERRGYEKETDLDCNLRLKALFQAKLGAIFCVGETLKEFEAGLAYDVIRSQVYVGLMGIKEEDLLNLVIAYEPVWSIGTGKNASEEIAENTCKYIRGLIGEMYSAKAAENIQILYGGSVKPENIHGYLTQDDVDGALVGGASLTAASFKDLIVNL